MGFKTWVANDVLTASDLMTYLMKQVVIVCTAATRPASPVEGMTIYETDTDLHKVYNGASWVGISGGGILHLRDEKAANTAGGTFTSGAWQTRTLNVERTDTIGSTLSANQFTLPAGTYWFDAYALAFEVNGNKLRLYNVTDAAEVSNLLGSTCYANAAIGTNESALLQGQFTIAGTKTFQLEHRCTSTLATNGFGFPANVDSKVEIYAEVLVRAA